MTWSDKRRSAVLNIWVDQKDPYENLFQEAYPIKIKSQFIEKKEEKKHNMNSHAQRFRDKIKLNNEEEVLDEIMKWKIVPVKFWMNIWSEINGIRPAIIYKHDNYRYGEDIIVIPITSYEINEDWQYKSKDQFDIEIEWNETNWLKHTSLIKIRQMKCISKKRFQKWKESGSVIIRGKIDNEEIRKTIDNNVRVMFWI